MKHLVIGDVHGNHQGLTDLLDKVGVPRERGDDGFEVWCVGDLINFASTPDGWDDLTTLEVAATRLDGSLIGNHEAHLWNGELGFSGMFLPTSPEATELRREAFALDRVWNSVLNRPFWHPAKAIDGWLLTHAGLHPHLQKRQFSTNSAEALAEKITELWNNRDHTPSPELFEAISRARGGRDTNGGIFWCDLEEIHGTLSNNRVPQIIGHTQVTIPVLLETKRAAPIWCLDTSQRISRLCGLLKDGDQDWKTICVESAERPNWEKVFNARG